MSEPTRVLFGDDDAEMVEIVSDLLTDRGFEVIAVRTAPDLYTAARNDDPDIVISDYDYGRLGGSDEFPNGLAVGVRLRSEGNDVPFVIWSGLARRDAAEAGFPCFLKDEIPELPGRIEAVLADE